MYMYMQWHDSIIWYLRRKLCLIYISGCTSRPCLMYPYNGHEWVLWLPVMLYHILTCVISLVHFYSRQQIGLKWRIQKLTAEHCTVTNSTYLIDIIKKFHAKHWLDAVQQIILNILLNEINIKLPLYEILLCVAIPLIKKYSENA